LPCNSSCSVSARLCRSLQQPWAHPVARPSSVASCQLGLQPVVVDDRRAAAARSHHGYGAHARWVPDPGSSPTARARPARARCSSRRPSAHVLAHPSSSCPTPVVRIRRNPTFGVNARRPVVLGGSSRVVSSRGLADQSAPSALDLPRSLRLDGCVAGRAGASGVPRTAPPTLLSSGMAGVSLVRACSSPPAAVQCWIREQAALADQTASAVGSWLPRPSAGAPLFAVMPNAIAGAVQCA
jgi:hypothetical protein